MKPSAFLRTLLVRFPAWFSSSPVAPLPVRSSFDGWLVGEFDALRCLSQWLNSYTSARWVLHALDVAVATQKMTMESLSNVVCRDGDCGAVDDYLEDVVELLDACNRFRERMETIQKYIESLRIVLHYLEGESQPNETVLARALVVLDSCQTMERRCPELEKCNSGLRKLGEKLAQGAAFSTYKAKAGSYETNMCETDLYEVLSGSKAVALLACGLLGTTLSFKSKHGMPASQSRQTSSWSCSLNELHKEVKDEIEKRRKCDTVVLTELRQTVMAAWNLRDLMNSRKPVNKEGQRELRVNVEALRRSCGDLEEGIKPLEGRVNELYRHLISVRMALLGILSQA